MVELVHAAVNKRRFGPDADGYWFILPATVILVCLIVYPFCLALWFSLSDSMIGAPTSQFVGLDNFIYLVSEDDIFRKTVGNTIIFAVVSVLSKVVLGMLGALLLLRALFLKRLFRGALLVPFVAPTALTTLGWWLIFDPTYSQLNWLFAHVWPFTALEIGPYLYLGDPTLAMSVCILVNVWRGLPFFIITILAGLVAIPKELYEAADMDGASGWQRFWTVTLPLLRPVLAIVILFSTIFTLSEFNIVYVLTRGGPINSTHLFATYSFMTGVSNREIGLGAAIALFLFPLLFVFVLVQLRLIRRDPTYDIS